MTVSPAVARARELSQPAAQIARVGRPNAWWGMLIFIATEATLFLTLVASYFYIRFKSTPQWPPDGIPDPTLTIPLVMTALLTASVVPAYFAELGIRKGNRARLEWGLIWSLLLGTIFLLVQAHEFITKAREHPPDESTYGSLFFVISGLDGAHVVVGVALLAWAMVRSWTGAFTPERHTGVQVVVLYWYFVQVAWLLVLATLYLSPHL